MFGFDQTAVLSAAEYWDALIRCTATPDNETEMLNSAAFLFWGYEITGEVT